MRCTFLPGACVILVCVLLSGLAGCAAGSAQKTGETPEQRAAPKVAVWSAWTHNAEYALDCRFGVTRTELIIGDTVMWDTPWMVLEVRNVGQVTRRLHALGPGGPALTCSFYAANERVGYYPVVGDAMDDAIDLPPGETLRRVVGGMWSLKDPGRKDVRVGFRVVVPGHDPVELRTAPIVILFKMGDTRKQGD